MRVGALQKLKLVSGKSTHLLMHDCWLVCTLLTQRYDRAVNQLHTLADRKLRRLMLIDRPQTSVLHSQADDKTGCASPGVRESAGCAIRGLIRKFTPACGPRYRHLQLVPFDRGNDPAARTRWREGLAETLADSHDHRFLVPVGIPNGAARKADMRRRVNAGRIVE